MAGARSTTEPIAASLRVPPVAVAGLAQALGWMASAALVGTDTIAPALAAQGAIAAIVGRLFGLASWWVLINLAFPVLVGAVSLLSIAPGWYLAAFVAMVAVYWSTFRTQVPLYLSGRRAIGIVASRLPNDRPCRFLDVGSGTGTVLAHLAKQVSTDVELHGLELAPLPHAIAQIRSRLARHRFSVKRQDFWRCDLGAYDVVYAFLSPVPMPALWRKARTEMRPGSLFISNTFIVPGVPPDESIALGDGARMLHLWRMR